MVENPSVIGAFPTLSTHSHPTFPVEEEEFVNEEQMRFDSDPFPNTTINPLSSDVVDSGGDSYWSENNVEEKQSENSNDDASQEEETESYEEIVEVDSYDGDHLSSICTDDTSTAEGPLLWRMNPKNSWSDWKIIVSEEDDVAQSTTYYVHKALLASGPRRSRYFRRLFRTDELAENSNSSCDIRLPSLSARAFPHFLDLVYDQSITVDHTDPIICKHVVGMFHLADLYQVNDLVKEIRLHFIPKIGLDEACTYYRDAVSFDPPIRSFLDHILKVCTSNVLRLDATSPLLRAMEPEFLLAIFETERRRRETRVAAGAEALHISRHLSTLIVGYVAYCNVEGIELEDRLMAELTDIKYIPSIDFRVVLEWSRIVVPKIMRMHAESDEPLNESDPALNIQLRIVESLKENISKVNLEDRNYRDFLKSLPADIAVDVALELNNLQHTIQQEATKTRYKHLQERYAELEEVSRQRTRDLGRFEVVSPGKKSSLKKVLGPPPSSVPPGVRIPSSENGHLQVNGRPLFYLRPVSPPTGSSVSTAPRANLGKGTSSHI
jgi:hypothetical protein